MALFQVSGDIKKQSRIQHQHFYEMSECASKNWVANIIPTFVSFSRLDVQTLNGNLLSFPS